MVKKITENTRLELLDVLNHRYLKATKKEKARILNEFVAISGYHRKHAIRLLGDQKTDETVHNERVSCKQIYDEAVKSTHYYLGNSGNATTQHGNHFVL